MQKKGTLHIVDLRSGNDLSAISYRKKTATLFPSNFPESKTKALLSSCSDIRAFIRLCTFDVVVQTHKLLDDNDKTIGILSSEKWRQSGRDQNRSNLHLIALRPLRGYEREIEKFEKALSGNDGMESAMEFRELFLLLMGTCGLNVGGYSSKIKLELKRDAPIHESAQKLLRFTLSVMRQNENGIITDIDTEFLHDYRVAIRRSRSILKQLKGVFAPKETAYYLNQFLSLGKRTNALRDMDVYLLHRTEYSLWLPALLQPSLKPFFSDMEASRKKMHKQCCRHLDSAGHRSFLDKWERWITQTELPDAAEAPNASTPTATVAASAVRKSWKKVVRHGRQISRDATDSELHSLRIDCKKLRYLLEFFSSIFPGKTIGPAIGHLKELQDNLGSFVDYGVQLEFLEQRLSSMHPDGGDIAGVAATGGLIATLHGRKEKARRKFHETFRAFDCDETAALFHELSTP
ncbi:MAG: CHAD domain-containing protein [Chlorobiaceae bacterium]